jgi:para-aminobenzoate synthetase component 1
MRLFPRDIAYAPAQDVFKAVAGLPYAMFLDSADTKHPNARYSFIAAMPDEMIESKDDLVTVTTKRGKIQLSGDPFKILQDRIDAWMADVATVPPGLPPFTGGAAGLFGYDLARRIENLKSDAPRYSTAPDMAVGIYDQIIAFDHAQKKSWILTWASDDTEAQRKQNYLLDIMNAALPQPSYYWGKEDIQWLSNFTQNQYQSAVQKTIEYIHAGDIFQANISQHFEAKMPPGFTPYAHYMNLRATSPAPFAAYLNLGNVQISSASPERFLTVRDNKIETRPIKGTKPRLTDSAADAVQIENLRTSKKDIAENVMIVDLMRNDLSKVCTPESIRVEKLCAVESFSNVHHLVSTITGDLQENKTPMDALRACFPGGSITGAPKIRAMEIIEEIEGARRGPYCGSIGYIGFDGAMDTNILIRTLIFETGVAHFNVGGGITADSDPAAEYQETLDKAAGIFDSFKAQDTSCKKAG